MKKRKDTWFANPNTFLQCPVEGCEHMGQIITKAHCRIVHDMDREDVRKQYGYPIEKTMKVGMMVDA